VRRNRSHRTADRSIPYKFSPIHNIWAGRPSRRWNVPGTDQHIVRVLGLNIPQYGHILSCSDQRNEVFTVALGVSASREIGLHPNSVFSARAAQPSTCIFPVFNRQGRSLPPPMGRFPSRSSPASGIGRGPHFAFTARKAHNMRLSSSRSFLSAEPPAAYHAPLCRVVPGHRRAAWRRVRSLPAAPLSIGPGQ
jgi:hypothetical protein